MQEMRERIKGCQEEGGMRCSCGRLLGLNPWITGIARKDGVPVAVEFQCPCGKGESPWAAVSREVRQQAYLAELSRNAASEMACWNG